MGLRIEAAVVVGRAHVRREAGQSALRLEAPDLSSNEPMMPHRSQTQPCELCLWTRCSVLWQANLGAVSRDDGVDYLYRGRMWAVDAMKERVDTGVNRRSTLVEVVVVAE